MDCLEILNIIPVIQEILLEIKYFKGGILLSNKDEANGEILASESEKLKDKYSQMKRNFEGVKKQAYEPQIQGLGQVQGQQNQQDQG